MILCRVWFFSCVAFTYKLSNKFIEDFERIIEFAEDNNVSINGWIIHYNLRL